MTIRRLLGTLALGLVVPLSPGFAWASGGYSFNRLADTTGPVSTFGGFSLNNSGTVVYYATLDSGDKGIYTTSGGAPTTIANGSDFRTTGFDQFPAINDSGTAAFVAVPYNGGEGIYTGSGGAISTVAYTDGPLLLVYTPVINTTGTVAFRTMLDNNTKAIYAVTGGATTTIADNTGAFNNFGDFVALNDSGKVAFEASLDAGGSGIYTGSGGPTTTIADTSSGTFSGFSGSLSMNDSGTVAYLANLTAGGSAIYTSAGGSTPIAQTGGAFTALGAPVINNSGNVFYGVVLSAGGLGLYVNSTQFIGTGDALDGSTVTSLNYFLGDYNDNGDIAFYASLADGRSGIYLASPASVPEPSSLLMLAGGVVVGLLGVAPRMRKSSAV